MDIRIISEALRIYISENSLSYGYNISGDIDETNYSENVQWSKSVGEDNKGIPMEAPINWADLQTYVTKANTWFEGLETARTNRVNLKASAKAKLIAGEALTEDEASILIV